MQTIHIPKIDARYWAAITMASVFGTNLGDYYAHESGLGPIGGVPILLAIAGLIFYVERRDRAAHQAWYWLVIILIRTGATNIADYLAFGMRINMIGLSVALGAIIAILAKFQAAATVTASGSVRNDTGLPDTNANYWLAMLMAGVFGTVLGDVCSHELGGGVASLLLSALLAGVLLVGRKRLLSTLYYYWFVVAVARTAGTAIGDWFAENRMLNIGLPLSVVITGSVFVAILLLWKSRSRPQLATT